MKTKVFLLLSLVVFVGLSLNSGAKPNEDLGRNARQALVGITDLNIIADQWIRKYSSIHPDSQLRLVAYSIPSSSKETLDENTLILLTDEMLSENEFHAQWKIAVGRDVVVPVINAQNPFFTELTKLGVSAEDMTNVLRIPDNMKWSTLIQEPDEDVVKFYVMEDDFVKHATARFLNLEPETLGNFVVRTPEEFFEYIEKEPLSIGFCRLTQVIDVNDYKLKEGIAFLPIDKDGNDKLDFHESIYGSVSELMRGIWIGKYPKSLIRNLFIASTTTPANESAINFLKWVITDGQSILGENGFTELWLSERNSKLEGLSTPTLQPDRQNSQYAVLKIIGLIILGLVILGLIYGFNFRRKEIRVIKAGRKSTDNNKPLDIESIHLPQGLYYDKTHTWVFMEQNGKVRLGIDEFIQRITGPFTRIKLRNPGDFVKKNEPVLSLVQDGKHISISSPVSGTIIDVNEELIAEPDKINNAPYTEGWVYLIEPANWLREIQFMRMAERYTEWLKNELVRFKDFLANTINTRELNNNAVSYQEGGELKEYILQNFEPEVWEEFQKKFIETSELK